MSFSKALREENESTDQFDATIRLQQRKSGDEYFVKLFFNDELVVTKTNPIPKEFRGIHWSSGLKFKEYEDVLRSGDLNGFYDSDELYDAVADLWEEYQAGFVNRTISTEHK